MVARNGTKEKGYKNSGGRQRTHHDGTGHCPNGLLRGAATAHGNVDVNPIVNRNAGNHGSKTKHHGRECAEQEGRNIYRYQQGRKGNDKN